MTPRTQQAHPDRGADGTYRIRITGVLGDEWSGRAHGMAILVDRSEPERSCTELIGELPDEAALMGLLDSLYTHGARLLSVELMHARDRASESTR